MVPPQTSLRMSLKLLRLWAYVTLKHDRICYNHHLSNDVIFTTVAGESASGASNPMTIAADGARRQLSEVGGSNAAQHESCHWLMVVGRVSGMMG